MHAVKGSTSFCLYDERMPRRTVRWSVYFAFWSVLGLLGAGAAVIETARIDPSIPSWEPIVWSMTSLYAVGMVCPLVVFSTLRIPIARPDWILAASSHIVLLAMFSLAHTGGMVAMREGVYWMMDRDYDFARGGFVSQLLYEFLQDVPLYGTIVMCTLGFNYYDRHRDGELQAEHLRRSLAEARLGNLRGQLNPHFLFNTLNTISSVMYESAERADTMLRKLSDLLRRALDSSTRATIPLVEEVQSLKTYLEIMQSRFGRSVEVTVDVDRDAGGVLVPGFLLQPLAENAFEHGLAHRRAGGKLEVLGRLRGNNLALTVQDNGPGVEPADDEGSRGTGLGNTAARLRLVYGDRHRFDLANREGGGLRVTIEVPARREESSG